MSELKEEWRPIRGCELDYQISNLGRVRSIDREIWNKANRRFVLQKGKILKCQISGYGYNQVTLNDNYGKKFSGYIHHMIADTFIGDIPRGYVVNHRDGNKLNNSIDNLEIVTQSQDRLHAYKTGLHSPNRRLSDEQVSNVFDLLLILPQTEIAKLMNVAPSTINGIVKKRTYKNILNHETI